MKSLTFAVTHRVKVSFDESKFPNIMDAFNAYISDFGTDEDAYIRHGEHIARLASAGIEDFRPDDIVEGYGVVKDAGICVEIDDDAEYIERLFPEDV